MALCALFTVLLLLGSRKMVLSVSIINLLTIWTCEAYNDTLPADIAEMRRLAPKMYPYNNLTDTEEKLEKCWNEWRKLMPSNPEMYPTFSYNLPRRLETTTRKVLIESIETLGSGTIYSTCDQIPRFRFADGASLTTTNRFVTLTRTEIVEPGAWISVTKNETPECDMLVRFLLGSEFCDKKISSALAEDAKSVGNINFEANYPVPCYGKVGICQIINNEEVLLIYWPPDFHTRNICPRKGDLEGYTYVPDANMTTKRIMTTTAITFHGMNIYERGIQEQGETTFRPLGNSSSYLRPSVLYGDFTFTSPTMYLAHRPMTAMYQNAPDFIRKFERPFPKNDVLFGSQTLIRSAGIVPLDPDDLFSYTSFAKADITGTAFASMVAKGGKDIRHHLEDAFLATGPVNLANLVNPVPASAYYRARSDCMGQQTHCGTITDDSYRPLLVLRNSVWSSLLGDWYGCRRPYLVDPPLTLVPITTSTSEIVMPLATESGNVDVMSMVQPVQGSRTNDIRPIQTAASQVLNHAHQSASANAPLPSQDRKLDSKERPITGASRDRGTNSHQSPPGALQNQLKDGFIWQPIRGKHNHIAVDIVQEANKKQTTPISGINSHNSPNQMDQTKSQGSKTTKQPWTAQTLSGGDTQSSIENYKGQNKDTGDRKPSATKSTSNAFIVGADGVLLSIWLLVFSTLVVLLVS